MISREHAHSDRSDTGSEPRGEGWPQRLERARQERNHREMARLLLDAADTAMADDPDDESLERSQWLLERTQRSLDACGPHPECLTLLCELMECQCLLSQGWHRLGHPGQHHAARERVRDLAFEVARRGERSEDLGLRVSVILRAAEALDALSDLGDAHALRARAFHRLGAASLRETSSRLTEAASSPCCAARSYQ
ncbi:MAG: hypothetical protein RLZZ373_2444 [Pseudomonadota bacterium]|jgi:hypothetical protein